MRSSSSISVRQLAKSAAKGGVGQCIRTTLPYIRSDVPVLIVFKALGFVVRACFVPAKSRVICPSFRGTSAQHREMYRSQGRELRQILRS